MVQRRWLSFLYGSVVYGAVIASHAQAPLLPTYGLEECLNFALRQNPEVVASQKQIEAASGGVIEAKAGFYPTAQINGGLQYREPGFNNDPNRRPEEWNLSIRVTQSLYSGGSVRAQVALSKLTEDTRLQEYRATVDRTLLQVRTYFYDILLAESNVAVRQQSVAFYEGEVSRQRAKLDAGTGNKRDLLRAQVSLANERPNLIDAQTAVKNSYLRLSEVLGFRYSVENDQVPFRIRGALDYNPLRLNLSELMKQAELRRPELKAKQNDIESARQQVKIDRAPVLPHVDAFAAYESLNETSRLATQDVNHGYVVGINGTWQIFDGFAAAGRIKIARAKENAAMAGRDGALLSVQSDVMRAFYKLQQAESTIASQNNTVSLAEQALALSESSFEAGLGTQLDVLNSRLELTKARTVGLTAKRDYLVASAELQQAVSSDYQWTDQSAKTPTPTPAAPPAPAVPTVATPEISPVNPAEAPAKSSSSGPAGIGVRLRDSESVP